MDTFTDHIPLFPLSHGLFPDGLLPLNIFEPRYLDLIKRCHREQTPFGVVWLREGREVQVPGDTPSFFEYGCLAHIRRYTELQPALLQVLCQGGMRFELLQTTRGPYGVWQGDVRYIPADPDTPCHPSISPWPIDWGRPSRKPSPRAWETDCPGARPTTSISAAGSPTGTPKR